MKATAEFAEHIEANAISVTWQEKREVEEGGYMTTYRVFLTDTDITCQVWNATEPVAATPVPVDGRIFHAFLSQLSTSGLMNQLTLSQLLTIWRHLSEIMDVEQRGAAFGKIHSTIN